MDFYLGDELSCEIWFQVIKKQAILKSFNSDY
jgi:hypothetical protein